MQPERLEAIEKRAGVAMLIERQQEGHPDYEAETLRAIVDAELAIFEAATGIDLDDIARRPAAYLAEAGGER
jgi:hypothetical protein